MNPKPDARDETIRRLIAAWRGEIESRAVYAALAARERDPKRAQVLRRMSEAEAGHRARLERRMRELGATPPDADEVTLGLWTRLQIRFAPVEQILAWRERMEEAETKSTYRAPTGDPGTDALFAEIRRDEGSHALAARDMQPDGGPPGVEHPKGRLERILAREHWHKTGSSWVSGAVYGANDGLAAVFGIVAGVSGATGGSTFVLTAGLAGAIASALSMATGAYLAERSVMEVAAANIAGEQREVSEHPEEEREELSLFYQLKGMERAEADALAERVSLDPEAMLRALTAEELGGASAAGHPWQAALAAGVSTGVGAILPVLPFFWISGIVAVAWAAAISLIAHFVVGAAKSLFTLRSWWASGLEMTVAGVIVGGATYLAGLLFKVQA
ncbi:MAG TPA: VIT1/CCC1 transporter family protein [Candidatus Eisenbacteria bacterium]|nr:VIT1/CCC1 transporter family protein [Candidatus Eisenbacteria bacterium]